MARPDDVPVLVLSGQPTLVAVAAGGVLGALARYAVAVLLPASSAGIAWSTVLVNVTGCLLIGLLVGWHDRADRNPYVRPFLAVGVLGGYTTFSTYALDAQMLIAGGRPLAAAAYLVGTILAALLAVWVGLRLAGGGRPAAGARDSGAGEPA